MKKIVREFELSPEQLHTVRSLARKLDLTETTAGILYSRGVDTEEKMRVFLHPSRENMLSPFLMSGMKEAAELIRRAAEEEWRVAVFGDYDADGIGACAILSRALKAVGIEPYLFVPERADGYGMSVAAVDKIFDEFLPDLIITVDCGISNRREVAYIREQGAYVIVTDHHELPEELPDCIVVNPKLKDDYPYDNLCGAGVAFKLAQALIGERAWEFLDFAAISTVADSVPLLGENRDIVAEGLKLIEQNPHPAIAALLNRTGEVNAHTVSFAIAPRINAAGRMGDANAALRLFTSEDPAEIAELAARLNNYNSERQKREAELNEQAQALIRREGAFGNLIMLSGDQWSAGFLGLVAARITEEYGRPTILFARRGDMLKGSARSVEKINIFEALKSCSEYIEEFGGHSQAAGVNVKAENFEKLRRALDEYIGTHYSREDFVPSIAVCGEYSGGDARRLAGELALLEPCGVGNRRPLFETRARNLNASLLKPESPHVAITGNELDYIYFGGAKELRLLKSDAEKRVVFEYNLSVFRGKEYLKGSIRYVSYEGTSGEKLALDGFESELASLAAPTTAVGERMDEPALGRLIAEKRRESAYGLCAVARRRESVSRFPALEGLETELFGPLSRSAVNCVLLYPETGCDLSMFRDIVYLDGCRAAERTGSARVYFNGEARAEYPVSCEREKLLAIFRELRSYDGMDLGESYSEAARAVRLGCSQEQAVFALSVFGELGLIRLEEGRLRFTRGPKTELANSAIYAAVLKIFGEG